MTPQPLRVLPSNQSEQTDQATGQGQVVQELLAQLADKEQALRQLEAQWAGMTSGPVWRLALVLRRVARRVAPPATLRDHLLRLGVLTIHAWRREGLRSALLQASLRIQSLWPRKSEGLSGAPRPIEYAAWIVENEPGPIELDQQRQTMQAFAIQPVFSLIVSVADATPQDLRATVESVMAQTYRRWELYLVSQDSADASLVETLAELVQKDERISLLSKELGVDVPDQRYAVPLRDTGEFILHIPENDCLAPHLLYEVVGLLNRHRDADFIYWDEDRLTPRGVRLDPWFKPDWSPELLLSVNYLMPAVIRRQLLVEVLADAPGGGGALDWDVSFRCAERTRRIYHIPRVLFHRRAGPGLATTANAVSPVQCVEAHLRRLGLGQPTAAYSGLGGAVRVTWPTHHPRVSVVIPSKNKVEFLERCLTSLLELTAYPNLEVIVVDNQSNEPQTLAYYAAVRSDPRVRIVEYAMPFNFSAANNFGARQATGELLLFLNNDTEALSSDWLEELARWAERPEVGAVGAKLLYPDETIQHAGVVLGMEGHSSHVFWGAREGHSGPFGSVEWYRNYLAVTGACVMIRREVFDQIGGFDEDYCLVFSDVELCLRVVNHGYRVVYTPFARLRHHEGRSRALEMPASDLQRGYVHMREIVEAGDPYYNPNLSYSVRLPSLAQRTEETPRERLDRLIRAFQGEPASIPTVGATELPYQQVLTEAANSGTILHREDIYGSGPPNSAANPEVLRLILRYSRAPVLDVGCGTGVYVAAIQECGLAASGLEVVPDYVERARTMHLDVQLYDGRTIPFPDGAFDTAIAIEVLEHIPDWERTLREMLRVARRCVLISVPNIGVIPSMSRHLVVPWHLLEATHVNFYTADILSKQLNRIAGIHSHVFTYGAFQINGDMYHNHVFAVIHKTQAAVVKPSPENRHGTAI